LNRDDMFVRTCDGPVPPVYTFPLELSLPLLYTDTTYVTLKTFVSYSMAEAPTRPMKRSVPPWSASIKYDVASWWTSITSPR